MGLFHLLLRRPGTDWDPIPRSYKVCNLKRVRLLRAVRVQPKMPVAALGASATARCCPLAHPSPPRPQPLRLHIERLPYPPGPWHLRPLRRRARQPQCPSRLPCQVGNNSLHSALSVQSLGCQGVHAYPQLGLRCKMLSLSSAVPALRSCSATPNPDILTPSTLILPPGPLPRSCCPPSWPSTRKPQPPNSSQRAPACCSGWVIST